MLSWDDYEEDKPVEGLLARSINEPLPEPRQETVRAPAEDVAVTSEAAVVSEQAVAADNLQARSADLAAPVEPVLEREPEPVNRLAGKPSDENPVRTNLAAPIEALEVPGPSVAPMAPEPSAVKQAAAAVAEFEAPLISDSRVTVD